MRPFSLVVFTALITFAGCSGSRTDTATTTKTGEGQASTAPSGREASNRDRALVRFVNADAAKQSLDLWFGDERAFTSVAYRSVTPYQELPTERRMFSVRTSGQMQELDTNSEGLVNGRRYTVVAMMKADGGTTLRVAQDDLSAPATGRAKVRMIHAAPEAGELSLLPANRPKDAIFDDVDFKAATEFKEINPVTTGLVLKREDQKQPALQMNNLSLQPDRFYTIIISGAKGSLEPIRIEDQLSGPGAAQAAHQ